MPDSTSRDDVPISLEDDVRALSREQWRLRAEIDRLREEQRKLVEERAPSKDGDSSGKKESPDKKGQQEKQDEKKDSKQEGKPGGEEGKDQQDKKEEKPRPPLRQRAAAWTRQHPLGVILIVIAIVVLVVGGYFLMKYLGSYVDTDDAEIDGHIEQIGSRVAGTVVGVYTENNRSVVQNQVLVDLDPSDYQSALAQAKANLAQAEAGLRQQAPNVPITQTTQATQVTNARHEVTNAQAAVESAQQTRDSALADLQQAEAQAANAAAEERRYKTLVDKDEISREQYDQKATDWRAQIALVASRRAQADAAAKTIAQRDAALLEARENLSEAQANEPRQLAVQHATVATREANVAAAKAQVEQARLNLSYCKIMAPEGGIVGDKTVEVGQQVSPGQELMAITPTNDLWVTANFKETQIENMHPNQRVTVHVDAIDLDFEGYIENMPGATGARYSLLPPENATGNYVKVVQRLPVRIRFKSNQRGFERLRPGMSVEPKVWVQ